MEPPALRIRKAQRERVIAEARRWAAALPAPAAVILVGSYARGDFNAWSDVDLILVAPWLRGLSPLERLRLLDAPPGYEVVAWTPEEALEMLQRRNPLAVEAVEHGIVLRDDLGLAKEMRAAWRRLMRG